MSTGQLKAKGQLTFHALDAIQGKGKELAKTKLELPEDLNWSVSSDGSQIAFSSSDQLHEQIRILDMREWLGAQRPASAFSLHFVPQVGSR
jgi:hypothetical protein